MTADRLLWGAATAATCVEGAARERGESIWDAFAARPGAVAGDHTPARAAEHLAHLWEDVGLLAEFGLGAHRFSVAWPRVQPDGRGRPDQRGLDVYDRMVDLLGEAGIAPWPVFYHWDLPQALQRRGGWAERDTSDRFADYACLVAERLGDRVRDFTLFGGTAPHAWYGHATGEHAPGLASASAFRTALHHQNLAQGLATRALRRESGRWRLGTAVALRPMVPFDDTMASADAVARADALWHGAVLDPLLHGRYPEIVENDFAGIIEEKDLHRAHSPLDFLVVDYCGPAAVRYAPDAALGVTLDPAPPGATRLDATGQAIDPAALGDGLRRLSAEAGTLPLHLTLGIALADTPDPDARTRDPDRIAFLDEHITAARDSGADLHGIFLWSLLDGFAWQHGYDARTGLIHVTFADQKRRPKDSLSWVAERIDT